MVGRIRDEIDTFRQQLDRDIDQLLGNDGANPDQPDKILQGFAGVVGEVQVADLEIVRQVIEVINVR